VSEDERVALVTGANRGLGLETSRRLAAEGYRVLMACRDEASGRVAAQSLEGLTERLEVVALDITDRASVDALVDHVETTYGRLDVLVNNAGIMPDRGQSFFETGPEVVRRCFETNTLGAFHMCQAFVPMMRAQDFGRVVNVSTGMAQLSSMNGGAVAYRMSKAALHALTRVVHDETRGTYVKVNAVCPGWVQTDLGGQGATRTIEEGVDGIFWLATLRNDGPSGGFFRDCKQLDW